MKTEMKTRSKLKLVSKRRLKTGLKTKTETDSKRTRNINCDLPYYVRFFFGQHRTSFDYIGQRLISLDYIGHLTAHTSIKYYPISFDYVGHESHDLTTNATLQPASPT